MWRSTFGADREVFLCQHMSHLWAVWFSYPNDLQRSGFLLRWWHRWTSNIHNRTNQIHKFLNSTIVRVLLLFTPHLKMSWAKLLSLCRSCKAIRPKGLVFCPSGSQPSCLWPLEMRKGGKVHSSVTWSMRISTRYSLPASWRLFKGLKLVESFSISQENG